MTKVRLIFTIIVTALITIPVSSQAASLNSALQDCAKIQRDLKRLACFDKLSGRVASFATETISVDQQETTTAVPNTPITPTVVATPQTPEAKFGLQDKPDADEVEVITSTIPGEFRGWEKGDEITLANGQIWKITGNSTSLYHKATNPKIEIRKSLFGSYRIKVIGLNKRAQVIRIQ